MRSLGSMLAETYASWLHSVTTCCGDDERPRQGVDNKPIIIHRDQPGFVPPPSAQPSWSNEKSYEKSLDRERSRSRGRPSSSWSRGTAGTPWFSRSSSSRRRPKISGPSNFRHLQSESFQFPEPQPTQKRFSFRPLELNLGSQDHNLSPLLPTFDDDHGDRDNQITPPPRAHTAASNHHDRSYSSMSFHIPRKHVRDGSGSINSQTPMVTPPRIPPKSRARAHTSPNANIETIVERIASALIEKERLQAEIESIMERQSIYISSRPSTAYGPADLEPVPSIPALPAAAPSFAERLSSDGVGRPHTAPGPSKSTPTLTSHNEILTPQERTLALAAAAFHSHPFRSHTPSQQQSQSPISPTSAINVYTYRNDDRPLHPPLPLVLRPPLRKKKSFSRVSNWLFPDHSSPERSYTYASRAGSVTNAPKPVRGGEGYYQPTYFGSGGGEGRESLDTWETTDEEEEGEEEESEGAEREGMETMTTWSLSMGTHGHGSPVIGGDKGMPVVGSASPRMLGEKKGLVVPGGPRPTSVGVAF